MKILPPDILNKLSDRVGIEPIIALKLELDSNYLYADEIVQDYNGKILEVSEIKSEKTSDNTGNIQSVTIKLEDSDFSLKNILTTTQFTGKLATLFYRYEGDDDEVEILKGLIATPVIWADADRTLTFDIVAKIDSREVGCFIEEDSVEVPLGYQFIESAYDAKIPIVFGTVEDVPSLKILEPIKGTLKDSILNVKPFQQQTVTIENGEKFPQNVYLRLYIKAIPMIGIMNGNEFTIFTIAPDEEKVTIQEIGEIDPGDYINGIEVEEANIRIRIAENKDLLGKCLKAIQRTVNINVLNGLVTNPYTHIERIYKVVIQNGRTLYLDKEIKYTIKETGFNNEITLYPPDDMKLGIIQCEDNLGPIEPGAEVYSDGNHVYAFNCAPTVEVYDVKAWRTDTEVRTLASLPPEAYTINFEYTLGSLTFGAIVLTKPLPDVWDMSTLYVSLKSTLSPNTVDVIEYLLTHYTNAEIDGASFTNVKALIENYPSNFALIQDGDTISVCNDIAWQARCALFLSGRLVKIIYLSKEPESVGVLTDEEIEEASLEISLSDLEDIVTNLIAVYKLKGSDEKETRKHYKNNIALYGLRKEEKEFYIYNVESLILKSLTFWGFRYSNQWILLSLKAFLTEMYAEVFDALGINSELITTKTIVEDVNFDTSIYGINYELWTPIIAGTSGQANAWQVDTEPKPADVVITKKYIPYQMKDVGNYIGGGTNPGTTTLDAIPTMLIKATSELQEGGQYTADIYNNGYAQQPTTVGAVITELNANAVIEPGQRSTALRQNDRYYSSTGGGGGLSVRAAAYYQTTPSGIQIIDDVLVEEDDLVLLPDDEVYTVKTGAWEIKTVAIGTVISVKEGTYNGGLTFVKVS